MISCCLIVKNEIDTIERCIDSINEKLSEVVDDIVVVDTGSTDGTRELLDKINCNVFDFEWVDDFAKARNFSVEKSKNNWILIIDADEYIEHVNIGQLKKFIKKADKNTICDVYRKNINEDGSLILDEKIVRIYNKKNFDFRVRIHERLKCKNNKQIFKDEIDMLLMHTGYAEEILSNKDKDLRNVRLIEKELEKHMVYDLFARLGSHYYAIGDIEGSVKAYEDFINDSECKKKDYYVNTVKKLQKIILKERLHGKYTICENVWDICSNDDEYVYNMAILYGNVGEYNKAVECYLKCVNKKGKMIIDKKYSYYPLAQIFEEINEIPNAIHCYTLSEDIGNAKQKVIELQKKLEN